MMGSSATQHEEPLHADHPAAGDHRGRTRRAATPGPCPHHPPACRQTRSDRAAGRRRPPQPPDRPMVGMNQHTVAQWRRRFAAERLAGLQDRKRPGRPLVYDHDQRLRIVATVNQQPPDPASHWSHSQLAKELADMGISASQIGRILADLDIKPHRVRSWITRPDDPTFWERAADICGLYLVPPTNALVLSVDEKTGMPARSRTRPTTRPAPGRPTRQEHEYVR